MIEWLQAQLPVTKSGLGLHSAEQHSSASFLISLAQAEIWISQIIQGFDFSLLKADVALTHYSNKVGETEPVVFDQISHESQKNLSFWVDSCLYEQLLNDDIS